MANNYPIIDGGGLTKTFKTTETAGVHTVHHNIDAFPGQHIDSFSRLRTAEPGYRFDSQLTYQIDSDSWDVLETGDGAVAHDGTERIATLTAGATAGANTAVLQSHYHSPYTSGRGQLALITFVMPGTVPTNGEVGVGYYDGENGVYLLRTASGLTLNIASTTSAGAQSVAQASWNIDPMDGTGPSGLTLDVTATNIIAIPMQALYVGRVVVAFDIDGQLWPVHEFLNANNLTAPYIAQASLPVRYWASTSTDATAAVIHAVCCSVISEGGANLQDIPGRTFVAKGTVENAASGTIMVIRCKEQFNGIDQNALVIPDGLDAAVQDNGCWVEVRRNATVTAGDFEAVDALSTVEVSYAGNSGTDPVVTAGTGTLVDTFWIPASASIRTLSDTSLLGKTLLCYSHLLGVADTLSVIFNGGSATTDVRASLKWKEIR